VLWYGPLHTQPVKLLLVRKPDRQDGYDIAIATTDLDATAAELMARYQSRWTIETSFQEAKSHGVGQARNRVQRAVGLKDPGILGGSDPRCCPGGRRCSSDGQSEEVLR
jgi:Transposase DDE domain